MGKILTRILQVLMGRMAARAAQFAVFILMGRTLDATQFGWYALLTTTMVLATQLGSLGLRQSSAYWLARGLEKPGTILANLLLVCVPLALLSVIGAMWVVDTAELHRYLPLILIVGMTGAIAATLMQGVFLGRGQTRLFAAVDSLQPVLLLIGTGALYLAGRLDFHLAIGALMATQILTGAIAVALAIRSAGMEAPRIGVLPRMVRHGLAFAVNVFLILLSTRIAIFLVDRLTTTADAGQFFAGQRLGDMLGEAAIAAGIVLFSDAVRTTDQAESLRRNAQTCAWVLWGFALPSLAFVFLAAPMTELMFGKGFEQAAVILQITALSMGPSAATKIIYPTLAAYGHPLLGAPAILASIVVNVAVCLILIPQIGVAGAAWAVVASQVTLLLGYALVMRIKFGIPFGETLLPRWRRRGLSES